MKTARSCQSNRGHERDSGLLETFSKGNVDVCLAQKIYLPNTENIADVFSNISFLRRN